MKHSLGSHRLSGMYVSGLSSLLTTWKIISMHAVVHSVIGDNNQHQVKNDKNTRKQNMHRPHNVHRKSQKKH